jgi:hypothetical protein
MKVLRTLVFFSIILSLLFGFLYFLQHTKEAQHQKFVTALDSISTVKHFGANNHPQSLEAAK